MLDDLFLQVQLLHPEIFVLDHHEITQLIRSQKRIADSTESYMKIF